MINLKDIIKKPIITEKSASRQDDSYSFKVDIRADKKMIKTAIEKIFKVTIVKIQTAVVKGKNKKMLRSRKTVSRPDWKKAQVLLKAGQKIDIFGPEAKGK